MLITLEDSAVADNYCTSTGKPQTVATTHGTKELMESSVELTLLAFSPSPRCNKVQLYFFDKDGQA